MRDWLLLVVFFFIIGGQISNAQNTEISSELAFAKYLGGNKQYEDEVFVLKALLRAGIVSSAQKDSIHYLLGGAYYQSKILDSASYQFDLVSPNITNLYTPAVFWKSYLWNYLGQTDEGYRSLTQHQPTDSKFKDLKNFQLAGNALLRRKYNEFDSYANLFNGSYYQFAKQETQLQALKKELIEHKYKSPFLAGIMSAIVPGSGKIYAGKVGQGIATIMATTIMGIQTYESHRRDGANSPRFIIYASLLSSFYIANVWGSVISVNVRKREFDDTINKEILFNMHIPLRTLFN